MTPSPSPPSPTRRGSGSPSEPAVTPPVPTATYRLQLQPDFPFAAAAEAAERLARLGVSHLHLSPVLTAVPGSPHGYDVTDHTTVRAELGGEEGLRDLASTAHDRGLGLVVDVVPNHMAVPADLRLNRPLWETLREGPGSRYARWFDVDWEAGGGRMLLPVLGRPVAEELPRLRVVDGTLRHGDRVLPLRPGTEELALPALLEAQHYRLAWWRLARTELNYRRFFTVSELIGVRVEDPEVFDATHRTLLRLLREGVVDGLRVDHPDGLADPGGYLDRLHEAADGRWTVVEKILGRGEELDERWPVAGTTGYDALRHIDGVFTDRAGHAELTALYRERCGARPDLGGDWTDTVRRAGADMAGGELTAEIDRLTRTAAAVCRSAPDLRLRDHGPAALRAALRRLLTRLPVYRPYVTPGAPARAVDVALLEAAAEEARQPQQPPEEALAVDVVRDLALGRLGDGRAQRDFAARFAQVSSALRAKAVEDTAYYRHVPLLSACEVGGDPGEPAVRPEEFHAFCDRQRRTRPAGGTALTTHDTKRSADVRARLAVLAECPERWGRLLGEVAEASAPPAATGLAEVTVGAPASAGGNETDQAASWAIEAAGAPDPHTAWVAWQTAFGLGVPDAERLVATVRKSVREAGLRTSWTEPDADYEAAVERFVRSGPCDTSWPALAALSAELAPYVRANVLGAALLHLTMPGVPDLYQGTERTYAALVDPDNRRPPRPGSDPSEAAGESGDNGELAGEKERLTRAALRLRRERPEWFTGEPAAYAPLPARGEAAEHCLAYVRAGSVVTAVTRLALRLERAGGWRGTVLPLPDGDWRDALSGRRISGGRQRVDDLLADAPVALLVRA